ncbi:MAG: extracellular solute-binding protein [Treponema sp.]|nr:extracellular solute-binding protein [Treponema sp.]
MKKKLFVLLAMLFTGFAFAQNSLTGLWELEENKDSDQQMFVEFNDSGKMDIWVAERTEDDVWEYEDKYTLNYYFNGNVLTITVGKKPFYIDVLFSKKRLLLNADEMNNFCHLLDLEVYPSVGEFAAFTAVKKAPQFKLVDQLSEVPYFGSNKELVVWSFTDELQTMIDNYYAKDYPNVKFSYSLTPTDQFPVKLDPVLASGNGAPDVFVLEDAFVRKYIEQGDKLLLDLTDIYNEVKSKMIAYPAEVGSYNGRVYALSWQVSPGAMFYRRSLAKKYLGTDSPKEVQKYFSDWDKFLETARIMNIKSNGKCVVVSSIDDLFIPFKGARKDPWTVNGRLVLDPAMEEYMEMCKTLHDENLEGGAGQWSENWFLGMRGDLRDEYGYRHEVFSYFLPTWGLHYVLKINAPETSGDWAMIPGPAAYRWGGTWLAASKGTKKAKLAKEFIKYCCTDDSFLERWAKDTGDVVSNNNVINRIKDTYEESFLGGQDHYELFAEIANKVDGKLTQGTDQAIERIWTGAVYDYKNGEKSKERAIADFKAKVETTLGFSIR